MNNSVRVTDLTHSFIKSGESESVPFLRVSSAFTDDTVSFDPLVIYFDEKATAEFDNYLDALKLENTDPLTPDFYCEIPGEKNLSINALPSFDNALLNIPVGLNIERKGTIVFSLSDCNLPASNVYFHDEATGTEQILTATGRYTVPLSQGVYNNRFSIRLYDKNSDPNEDKAGSYLLNVYNVDRKLIADIYHLSGDKGTLIVHNITGQLVFRKDIYSTGYHEFDTPFGTGIYIVTFITGQYSETKKILIF
jgi:hypothetical protein